MWARRCSVARCSWFRSTGGNFWTLRVNTAALLSINGSNELINLGGGLGNRYALMFAPLSIVQAIGSTTTLFVFAFGVVLSVLWPRLGRDNLAARELVQKGNRRGASCWRRRTDNAGVIAFLGVPVKWSIGLGHFRFIYLKLG